jgi:hypothetical protein
MLWARRILLSRIRKVKKAIMRLRFTRSDGGGWARAQPSLWFPPLYNGDGAKERPASFLLDCIAPRPLAGNWKSRRKSEIVSPLVCVIKARIESPQTVSIIITAPMPWIILFLRQCHFGTSKVMELQIVRQLLACKSQLADTLGCKWLSPKSNSLLTLALGWVLFAFPMESYALA